jgi:hypothetical protein
MFINIRCENLLLRGKSMDTAMEGYHWSVSHSAELDQYAGRWIAIGKDGIIAITASLKELLANKNVEKVKPFITRIPTKQEILSIL